MYRICPRATCNRGKKIRGKFTVKFCDNFEAEFWDFAVISREIFQNFAVNCYGLFNSITVQY